MPKYATVVLDRPIDKEFDYLIPAPLEEAVKAGVRVVIPFRSRRVLGYVVALSETSDHRKVREILSVRDRKPVVSEALLRLAKWISDYYFCSLSVAIRCIVPSSVRKGKGAKMPLFARIVPGRTVEKADRESLAKKAPKQALVVEILSRNDGPMQLRELLKNAKATRGTIRSLEKKGFVLLERERMYRDPWGEEQILPTEHLPPTAEQTRALRHIKEALQSRTFSVVLLHGITGSGKTEVYLQAIDEVLTRKEGAIVLVPEISLTAQTIERFKARFSEDVAVLHSRLSAGERLDEWERLREGRARVVVGARSAIFAPVPRLGLIVVDEEHERTYKQKEAPRYHARDVAVMRGKLEDAIVILGSATPSVESYRNGVVGKYRVFKLPRRVGDRRLPHVTIVDMKEEIRRSGRMTFFSRCLVGAMEERLQKGEQVILFLNRRGFSPFVICHRCGYVQKCPNCSISLTMHGEGQRLLCHICGFEQKAPTRCPRCTSTSIRFLGLGTQKLEMLASRIFPKYRVGRMDTDSMSGKAAHKETLDAFRAGELHILLGTQMIAKGLHFPNVTLVGVVSADTALHFPDFRASEYTFQLITQVAGRAGRGEVPGEVIVQTFAPNHPAIMAASHQDYVSFYRQEFPFREELGYPPVNRFILVTLRGRNEHAVSWISKHFAKVLSEVSPPGMEILGPAPSPISRAKGYFRWQLILKGKSVLEMTESLRRAMANVRLGKEIQVVVDVDPVSML
jgi:primosomal protein N' (replication factor Y)